MSEKLPYGKVTMFIPDLGYGGAQRVVVSLANYLVTNGHLVEIVTLNNGRNGLIPIIDQRIKINYSSKKLSGSFYYWIRYFWRTRGERELIISGIRYANFVIGICKILSLVGCEHKIVYREANTYRQTSSKKLIEKLKLWCLGLAYKQADIIVANSVDTKEDIISHVNADLTEKILVSDNPVSLEPQQCLESENSKRLKHLLKNRYTVGTVGRFESQKDHGFLIQSFAALRELKPDAALIIVGEGSLFGRYLELMQEFDLQLDKDVFLIPPSVQISCIKALFDLFCLTSRWEGFGNVLIESALCKVPVVVRDCPGGARLLVDKYCIGTLYSGSDPIEFGSLISEVPEVKWTKFNDLYQSKLSPEAWIKQIEGQACI